MLDSRCIEMQSINNKPVGICLSKLLSELLAGSQNLGVATKVEWQPAAKLAPCTVKCSDPFLWLFNKKLAGSQAQTCAHAHRLVNYMSLSPVQGLEPYT